MVRTPILRADEKVRDGKSEARQSLDWRGDGFRELKCLNSVQKIAKRVFEPNCPPIEDIAREQKITPSYATRLVRLTFLAPDIVAAILAGKQPAGLTANKLMADTRLPLDWRDQRAALGFASAR